MKDKKEITCDLLIIGAGFAGMVAAARASSLGLKTVQAGNSSVLFLASGLMDLLGVYPIDSGRTLPMPGKGIDHLSAEIPGHPYSKTGYKNILESFDFLKRFLSSAGLEYQSNASENYSVLTAAGTFKPSFMVPKTFLNSGRIKQGGKRLLFVDFKGLREFSAKKMVNVLQETCPGARAVTIDIPEVSGTLHPVHLAALFEEDLFLRDLAKKIMPFSKQTDLVGFPAVCGISNSLATMGKLEEMTGLDCFEIPGLPPSLPGLRLKNAFEKKLSQNNVLFLNNAKVKFQAFKKHQFILNAATQNMDTRITAKGVILASGRFQGGGLHAQRKIIIEPLFNLPVFQPGKRNQWHHLDFFNPKGHAINTAGLVTDDTFRPLDRNDTPLFKRLYAVGAILAHNDWARLKSGSGVSCVTAVSAVNAFYHSVTGRGENG